MRKLKVSTTLGCILLSFLLFSNRTVLAQVPNPAVAQAPAAGFELQDGERVVFVGNSLFENDLPYGYLELALTTRWPQRNVTFRNIGWTGDNVWGEARSYITNPPTAYELLIQQLTNAKPTLVFIAYGAIEALEGEGGLPRFKQGLNQLLDKVDQLGAKAILLSPVPVLAATTAEALAQRNAMLEVYGAAIAQTAAARGQRYLDVFKPLQEQSTKTKLSDNGIHLNAAGYFYLATALEKQLGLAPRQQAVTIEVSKKQVTGNGPVKVLAPEKDQQNIRFTLQQPYLPLPLPALVSESADNAPVLKITGLKKGFYTLSTDDAQLVTASADKWQEGVALRRDPAFSQASQLQEKIVKKNDLFFQQYRPLNRTYILGFRSYEQGRHTKTLDDLSFIITWLEGQIALSRTPKAQVYQLTPLK